jgi:hypothetical protein
MMEHIQGTKTITINQAETLYPETFLAPTPSSTWQDWTQIAKLKLDESHRAEQKHIDDIMRKFHIKRAARQDTGALTSMARYMFESETDQGPVRLSSIHCTSHAGQSTITDNPEDVLSHLQTYFTKAPPPARTTDPYLEPHLKDITFPPQPPQIPLIEGPTFQEYMLTINDLKGKKSQNLTLGIFNELLKWAPHDFPKHLHHILHEAFDTKTTPKILKQAHIILFHKKEAKRNPKNFRRISLLLSMLKVITNIFTNRLAGFVDTYSLLSESQAGSQADRTCLDILMMMQAAIEDAAQHGGPLHSHS